MFWRVLLAVWQEKAAMILSNFESKETRQNAKYNCCCILLSLAPESCVSPLHVSSYRDWLGILGTVVLRLERSVLGHRRRVCVQRLKKMLVRKFHSLSNKNMTQQHHEAVHWTLDGQRSREGNWPTKFCCIQGRQNQNKLS